jgi:tetratricopeptide (TPR) repeat protein
MGIFHSLCRQENYDSAMLDRGKGADCQVAIELPFILAQITINQKDPSKAIELFQTAAPYELVDLNIVFVLGNAYLLAGKGREAAAEFQKILDHRGLVTSAPIGALAHLQIGRAYAMQGDTAKAKAAYEDFLTLWKEADPDIPIFIAAKAEYASIVAGRVTSCSALHERHGDGLCRARADRGLPAWN